MAKSSKPPPAVIIFGEEAHQKATILRRTLDALLPPTVDRTLALTTYEGGQPEEQGGPTLANVLDELATLPFLAERRVVVILDADQFVSTHREALERYLAAPAPTGTLVLQCRSFPKTTRVYKAACACGGQVFECRKLSRRGLVEFVTCEAQARHKRLDSAAAEQLCDLVGADQGVLAAEVEKLTLYAADRPAITLQDVRELVGQTREEKIFAAMDAAGLGRLAEALELWHQVLATDPAAVYKTLGGTAFVLRRWLAAHRLAAGGMPVRAIAPQVMMWGRERELDQILRRLPQPRVERLLGQVGELDSQAKTGGRSIETGVEALLIEMAAPAR